jgi:HSP20 family protein
MTLVRWRPMRDMAGIHEEVNNIFDRFFGRNIWDDGETIDNQNWYPRVDISENDDEFLVKTELPGMKKDDVQITYANGTLKIEGERKQEKIDKNVNYHRVESTYGKFCRVFQIPTQVQSDKIVADFKDGVLNIRLPKAEEVKPKTIDVKIS